MDPQYQRLDVAVERVVEKDNTCARDKWLDSRGWRRALREEDERRRYFRYRQAILTSNVSLKPDAESSVSESPSSP